ncbi:MAG: hypothetical protein HZA22_02695 [Nitrospirae bacterium]|nr:hypothetical protein [Nitrospirota bacterium]
METRITAAIILAGLICLSIAGLFACKERALTKEEIAVKPKELNLPVYDFAQNVKFYNHEDVVRGVSYKVRLPYGPDVTTDILEFYDSKMQQLGYKPFVEDYYKYADRTWGSFIDGTIEGEPDVEQLKASWVDAKRTTRANLNLKYYWYVDHKQSTIVHGFNDDLNVDFQIMPFVMFPPPTQVQ